MGFIARMKGELRGSVIGGSSLSNPEAWLIRLLRGAVSDAEDEITDRTALNISTVYACVRNISEDVAKLPAGAFESTSETTRKNLPDEPAVILMNRRPNHETLPLAFRETLTQHALLRGNGVSEIEWYGNGRPAALWQQDPGTYTIERTKAGKVVYVCKSARKGGRETTLEQEDAIHIHGMGFNGLTGYSVVEFARKSFYMTASAERYGSGFFNNGAVPTGILEHPAKLADGGAKLKKSWKEAHEGGKRSVAVLEEGMKYQPIGISPEDSQFLETRQFQIPEICRWFRMPPHKVHDLSRGTFSNIEHQAIEYVTDTLLPWIIRWEQELARKFFHTGLNPNLARYIKLNVASLLRGDLESRYRAYAIGRQWGFVSVDDILNLEDRNPLPNGQGQMYLVPSNMVPADKMAQKIDAEIEGAKSKGTPPAPPPANPENGNQNRAMLEASIRAQEPVLEEALDHSAKIEQDKTARNAKRVDFDAWLASFYRDHRDAVRGHVFPFAEATASLAAAAGFPGADANKIATGLADRAIERAKAHRATGSTDPIDTTAAATAEIEHLITALTGAAKP